MSDDRVSKLEGDHRELQARLGSVEDKVGVIEKSQKQTDSKLNRWTGGAMVLLTGSGSFAWLLANWEKIKALLK